MEIKTIATGSSGNCYLLTAPNGDQLLLECGIPWKRIAMGMKWDFSRLQGCVISHEHMDHARAAKDLLKRMIMVWASPGTLAAINCGDALTASPIRANEGDCIEHVTKAGAFTIMAFTAIHDAAEPLMFVIKDSVDTLLFATDTQYMPRAFTGLTKIMIEANYDSKIMDENFVQNGDVGPRRRRVMRTHMSIDTLEGWLRECEQNYLFSNLKEIHLIHLSRQNSDMREFQDRIETSIGVPVYIEGR